MDALHWHLPEQQQQRPRHRPGRAHALVKIDGARDANSFSYYKKVINVDANPVKLLNSPGTQQTFLSLSVGAMIEFTVTGVKDAEEGPPSDPVSV